MYYIPLFPVQTSFVFIAVSICWLIFNLLDQTIFSSSGDVSPILLALAHLPFLSNTDHFYSSLYLLCINLHLASSWFQRNLTNVLTLQHEKLPMWSFPREQTFKNRTASSGMVRWLLTWHQGTLSRGLHSLVWFPPLECRTDLMTCFCFWTRAGVPVGHVHMYNSVHS